MKESIRWKLLLQRRLIMNRLSLLIKLVAVSIDTNDRRLALLSVDNLLTINSFFQLMITMKETNQSFDEGLASTITQKLLLLINKRILAYRICSTQF